MSGPLYIKTGQGITTSSDQPVNSIGISGNLDVSNCITSPNITSLNKGSGQWHQIGSGIYSSGISNIYITGHSIVSGNLNVSGNIISSNPIGIGKKPNTFTMFQTYEPGTPTTNWHGRIVAGSDNGAVVIGEYNGQNWIGGHLPTLGGWADLYIQPDGTSHVFLGGNNSKVKSSGILEVNHIAEGTLTHTITCDNKLTNLNGIQTGLEYNRTYTSGIAVTQAHIDATRTINCYIPRVHLLSAVRSISACAVDVSTGWGYDQGGQTNPAFGCKTGFTDSTGAKTTVDKIEIIFGSSIAVGDYINYLLTVAV